MERDLLDLLSLQPICIAPLSQLPCRCIFLTFTGFRFRGINAFLGRKWDKDGACSSIQSPPKGIKGETFFYSISLISLVLVAIVL